MELFAVLNVARNAKVCDNVKNTKTFLTETPQESRRSHSWYKFNARPNTQMLVRLGLPRALTLAKLGHLRVNTLFKIYFCPFPFIGKLSLSLHRCLFWSACRQGRPRTNVIRDAGHHRRQTLSTAAGKCHWLILTVRPYSLLTLYVPLYHQYDVTILVT